MGSKLKKSLMIGLICAVISASGAPRADAVGFFIPSPAAKNRSAQSHKKLRVIPLDDEDITLDWGIAELWERLFG